MPPNPITRLIKPDPYQDFFRVLADALDQAVLVISGGGDRILACNHAFLLLSGYSRRDLDDLTPDALFPGEAGEQALLHLLAATDQPLSRLPEIPLRTRDGPILLIDVESRPVGPGASFLLLTATSTSERKNREEAAHLEQERLSLLCQMAENLAQGTTVGVSAALAQAVPLLRATAVGVYRVSAASPELVRDGTLPLEFPETLSTTALKALHRPTSWSLGERPGHVLQRAARAAGLTALITAPVGPQGAWTGVVLAGWRSPADIPADAEGLLHIVAALCDTGVQLTQLKAASAGLEGQLLSLERERDDQFAASGEGLLVLTADLIIRRANPAACAILGYRAGDLEGLAVQEALVGPEDARPTLLDALVHEREAQRPRLILHRRDGTPFPAQLRALPIGDRASPRLLLLINDLSEQQAIEDRTETLAQRALLGEVAAIFAHEVRNPINNISTGVQLVASRLGRDHPQHEALERVAKECTRLSQLMSDVLFFARPLELKSEALDLADLLSRLLTRWEPRFKQAGITCHTAFDPATPPAEADPRTLEQIIVNLITNALQAMSSGGTLSISLTPAGEMVEMKVADTGPGIPPEIIDRIFDPFFTTKKDGTGLGLAIARRILTAHKGTIHVESFPDAGTVFTLRLPIAKKLLRRDA
ncbi:MAG: ATP-binding protein [Chloroflexota bacterium]